MRLNSFILIVMIFTSSLSGCAFIQGRKYQRIIDESAEAVTTQKKVISTKKMMPTLQPARPTPASTGATVISPITH